MTRRNSRELKVQGELTKRAWAQGRAGDERRAGPCADAHDRGEHGEATGMVPRSAVLHARAADDGHRAGLRPHHQRHRRGDDRLVRLRDAVLRDAEGTSRACRTRRT